MCVCVCVCKKKKCKTCARHTEKGFLEKERKGDKTFFLFENHKIQMLKKGKVPKKATHPAKKKLRLSLCCENKKPRKVLMTHFETTEQHVF